MLTIEIHPHDDLKFNSIMTVMLTLAEHSCSYKRHISFKLRETNHEIRSIQGLYLALRSLSKIDLAVVVVSDELDLAILDQNGPLADQYRPLFDELNALLKSMKSIAFIKGNTVLERSFKEKVKEAISLGINSYDSGTIIEK